MPHAARLLPSSVIALIAAYSLSAKSSTGLLLCIACSFRCSWHKADVGGSSRECLLSELMIALKWGDSPRSQWLLSLRANNVGGTPTTASIAKQSFVAQLRRNGTSSQRNIISSLHSLQCGDWGSTPHVVNRHHHKCPLVKARGWNGCFSSSGAGACACARQAKTPTCSPAPH